MFFTKYFKLPLKRPAYGSGLWTDDDKAAFEWVANLPETDKERIIAQINIGFSDGWHYDKSFSYDGKCYIKYQGTPLLRLVVWDMLTGAGGYNLPAEKAKEIQHLFALFVTWRLNQFGS